MLPCSYPTQQLIWKTSPSIALNTRVERNTGRGEGDQINQEKITAVQLRRRSTVDSPWSDANTPRPPRGNCAASSATRLVFLLRTHRTVTSSPPLTPQPVHNTTLHQPPQLRTKSPKHQSGRAESVDRRTCLPPAPPTLYTCWSGAVTSSHPAHRRRRSSPLGAAALLLPSMERAVNVSCRRSTIDL